MPTRRSSPRLGSWLRRSPGDRRRTGSFEELRESDPRSAWALLHRRATLQVEDPWELLGIEPGADWDEITDAHRSLAKQHHPDLPEVADEDRMTEINVAYRELRIFYGKDRPSRF